MKRFMVSILALHVASPLFAGTEIRKLGIEELELGMGTVTSSSGVISTKIHQELIPYADNTFPIKPGWVDVRTHGADPTGVSDSAAAIKRAIESISNGGTVFLPAGIYKITGGISMGDNIFLEGAGVGATFLVPGTDNINVIHHHGSYGGVRNLTISNSGLKKGISALLIAPLDENQEKTIANQNFNYYENIRIMSCSEGIVMRAGPDVGGVDSGCWYNTFVHINIFHTTRGVWLQDSVTAGGSGVNRNNWFGLRVGQAGTNTGIQIDAGDTNKFYGYSAEGINHGFYPNTVPTAIKIIRYGPVSKVENAYNMFFGTVFEANTRDIYNDSNLTEFIGHYPDSNTSAGNYPLPRAVGDTIVRTRGIIVDSQSGAATVSFSYGDTNSNWSVIRSNAGASGNYNGMWFATNDNTSGGQPKASLPSWAMDIGGIDGIKYPGSSDSITFL